MSTNPTAVATTEAARTQGRDYARPHRILDIVGHLDAALPAAANTADQPDVYAVGVAYCAGVADVLTTKVARLPGLSCGEAGQVVASIEAAIAARWSDQSIDELPSHALDIALAWLVRDTLHNDGIKPTPETFAARLEELAHAADVAEGR
jgi:hypothetical protein